MAEARQRLAQRRQEYLKEINAELANVRREVQANEEKLAAMTIELDRMQIRAPVAGQVIGLRCQARAAWFRPASG
jgi:protease secretion system membrane fusion protein